MNQTGQAEAGSDGRARRRHKEAADSVRAIAAAAVVLSHAIQIFWLPLHGLGTWTHLVNSFVSDTAVIVFFVLSGYMITASIHANMERTGTFRFGDYAVSRVTRIYPPLLFAIALAAILFAVMMLFVMPGISSPVAFPADRYVAREVITLSLLDIWHALTMRNGLLLINGALWSLYVEVKLYALAGLAAFVLVGAGPFIVRVLLALFMLAMAWRLNMGIERPHWVYSAWWVLGAAMFFAGQASQHALRVWLAVIATVAVAILALSSKSLVLEASRVAFVMIISGAMFFWWTWREPLTKSLAGWSYTLYLVHFPVLVFIYSAFVFLAGPNEPTATARIVLGSIGVAIAFVLAAAGRQLENTAAIRAKAISITTSLRMRFLP